MIATAETPTYATEGNQLTPSEREDLARLEQVMRVSLASIGGALLEIRDRRLYRATHPTFAAYCVERCDICARYANRLIRAVPIAENLGVRPGQVPERHLHELDGLSADDQRAVYERACVGGKPTAAHIREVRKQYESETSDEPASVPLRPAPAKGGPQSLIDRLRALATRRGLDEAVRPLLDELLGVFDRAADGAGMAG